MAVSVIDCYLIVSQLLGNTHVLSIIQVLASSAEALC